MLAAPPQQLAVDSTWSPQAGASQVRRARGQSRARQRVKLLGLVLLVIALAFGRTFLAVQMVIKGYQLEGLKQEISTLQRENERLQLEVARLKSPERVAAAATNRLGMVKPGTAQLYYVPGKAVPGQQVQVAVEEPLIKGAAIAAPGRQTWLAALSRALQDWLQPVHIARVNS